MTLSRYKLIIEYGGEGFSGWQRQENVSSVQQTIEEAIEKFSGQRVTLHAAGRTDAGVHACGQVAHVDLAPFSKPMSGFEIAKAINAHLRPRPVAVLRVEQAAPDFHARFMAVNKLYIYRILNRSAYPVIGAGRLWHVKRPLDVPAMREAARCLIGHHDFTTFRDSHCQAKNPMRTLDRLEISERSCDPADGREIVIEVEARSFLHHQVRNMVGTLALVGEGRWTPQDVRAALEAKDRTKGGPTAPPEGLYLARVDYQASFPAII